MKRLAWKLRRLRAMQPGEIVHRTRVALRDRLFPPAWELSSGAEAFHQLFAGPAGEAMDRAGSEALMRLQPGDAGAGAIVAAARAIAAGRWRLFGHDVTLDDPPVWHRNPMSGAEWPDLSSTKLDYRRSDIAGGVKWTWELGRLTPLVTLATGARLADDDALADRCLRWLADWNETNPLGHGIHYTSGIELAVRVITVSWTLAALGERACGEHVAAALGLMAQQALHCRDHLSVGSSANNHLLSEYAAMSVMGALHPTLRGAVRMRDAGVRGLETETLRQILPDGVPAEQAFGYLPFIWELLIAAFVASERSGRAIDPAVRERLRASLAFARTARLANGRLPAIGDEDEARMLLAELAPTRLDLVGNTLAAWLDEPALSEQDEDHLLARMLLGKRAGPARAASDGRVRFDHGGYTLWRHGARLVTFDHGPLGYLSIAAHGHADALAVTVHMGATPVVADPGTFAYHADRAARDRCRSTPVHGTVHFGGQSQSEMLGPFMWGRRATVVREGDAWTCAWITGERHTRAVGVAGDGISIDDRVRGAGATLVFPLAPGADARIDGSTACVTTDGCTARFVGSGIDGWRLEQGEHAPHFGRVVPAQRLVASIHGEQAQTRIEVR